MNQGIQSANVVLDIPDEGLCGFSYAFFEHVFCDTLRLSGVFEGKEIESIGMSVESLDENAMGELNKQTFGKQGPTDILSFPFYENTRSIRSAMGKDLFLGDIVLCASIIQNDAKNDGVSFEREMAFVFSHGILHLLGYEHGEEMFALQDKVCENGEREHKKRI